MPLFFCILTQKTQIQMDIDKEFYLVRKNEGNSFQRLMTFFLEQNKKHGADFGVAGMYNTLNRFYGK